MNLSKFLAISFVSAFVFSPLDVGASSGFQCWPSIRSTNLIVYEDSSRDELKLIVENPSGYELMPQFEGPVSAFEIPFVSMQTDDLKILGSRFTITWKKKDCETFDPSKRWLACSHEGVVSVPGLRSFTFSSFKRTEEGPQGTEVTHKFRFTLEREGNTYFVTQIFPEKSCRELP